MKIFLSAGHGGKDPGAQDGIDKNDSIVSIEKDITLEVMLDAGEILSKIFNHEVHYLRNDDRYLSPSEKLRYIRSVHPECFIEIHCNATGDPKAHGIETIYRDAFDKPLAQILHEHLCAYTGLKNRGLLQDGTKAYNRGLAVLKDEQTPACILELGYLTNKEEEGYIARNKELYAKVIAEAIDQWTKTAGRKG